LTRILLAEDDDFLRLMTKTILETSGFEVMACVNGQAALDAFPNYNPDLVVSDVSMPIRDGFGLLDGVRKLESGSVVPFLFLSARSEHESVMHARRMGADDYLFKPYEPDDLLDAVHARLKRREAIRLFDTRDAHLQTIILLANAIEARDIYTRGHVQRVQEFAVEMGNALAWTPEDMSTLEYGSLLHDIGKIVVPELVLNKTSKLTPEEFEIMKSHTTAGAKIITGVSHLAGAIPYILYHHEKWNGKGYPEGRGEKDIPLEGRILAFGDVFDALTSDRPYHKGMSPRDALDLIKKDVGVHFDPELAPIFIDIQEKKLVK
jgi:putative two-component system response regulator